jgi:hypothetical protein
MMKVKGRDTTIVATDLASASVFFHKDTLDLSATVRD